MATVRSGRGNAVGVVNDDGSAHALHDGQAGEVIAEKGDFRFLWAGQSSKRIICECP